MISGCEVWSPVILDPILGDRIEVAACPACSLDSSEALDLPQSFEIRFFTIP